jgi:hypothetical protein
MSAFASRWLGKLRNWLVGGPEPAPASDAKTTRLAEWADVETVAALLEKHRVEYVLVGGYALFANGLARQTGDIDIVVRDTPENNRRWIAALAELPDGAARELAGEDRPFPVEETGHDPNKAGEGEAQEAGVIRVNDIVTIDVMPKACGLRYEDLEPHIARMRRPGGTIAVLDLSGLLRTKQGLRPKDQSDRHRIEWALSRLPGGAERPPRE